MEIDGGKQSKGEGRRLLYLQHRNRRYKLITLRSILIKVQKAHCVEYLKKKEDICNT